MAIEKAVGVRIEESTWESVSLQERESFSSRIEG